MNYQIQSTKFGLTPALRNHTERQLQTGLSGFSDHIQQVDVRLGDNNGPKGGNDKFCRLHVKMKNAKSIFIQGVGVDMYAVISKAARRAGRNVNKRLDRVKRHSRNAIPDLAAD